MLKFVWKYAGWAFLVLVGVVFLAGIVGTFIPGMKGAENVPTQAVKNGFGAIGDMFKGVFYEPVKPHVINAKQRAGVQFLEDRQGYVNLKVSRNDGVSYKYSDARVRVMYSTDLVESKFHSMIDIPPGESGFNFTPRPGWGGYYIFIPVVESPHGFIEEIDFNKCPYARYRKGFEQNLSLTIKIDLAPNDLIKVVQKKKAARAAAAAGAGP